MRAGDDQLHWAIPTEPAGRELHRQLRLYLLSHNRLAAYRLRSQWLVRRRRERLYVHRAELRDLQLRRYGDGQLRCPER